MCVRFRASQEGSRRLCSQIGSGKASRLFISYFLFSCLRPLPVMLRAVVRAAVSAPRAGGSIGGNVRRLESARVCRRGRVRVVCVFGKQRPKNTVWSSRAFSLTRLLSQFVNQIPGRRRSFDWVMNGAVERRDIATMSWESWFPALFPRRSRLAVVFVCCMVAVARSGAGAILEGWLVTHVISPSVIVFVCQHVFIKSTNLNEWPRAFSSSPPSLIPFKSHMGSLRKEAVLCRFGTKKKVITASKVKANVFFDIIQHLLNVLEQS